MSDDTNSPLKGAFDHAMIGELEDAISKVRHCVSQLTDDQLWWRPTEAMNSTANLILHLCGNLRQWIVSGVSGVPDSRNRPQEFAHRDPIPKDDLLKMLDQVSAEVRETLEAASETQLLEQRTIQAHDVTGVEAVVHSIAHFRGHAQEIVHMTRIQLGDDYQFDFIPGPDQHGGAARVTS